MLPFRALYRLLVECTVLPPEQAELLFYEILAALAADGRTDRPQTEITSEKKGTLS